MVASKPDPGLHNWIGATRLVIKEADWLIYHLSSLLYLPLYPFSSYSSRTPSLKVTPVIRVPFPRLNRVPTSRATT
jgi:hypothetical protein